MIPAAKNKNTINNILKYIDKNAIKYKINIDTIQGILLQYQSNYIIIHKKKVNLTKNYHKNIINKILTNQPLPIIDLKKNNDESYTIIKGCGFVKLLHDFISNKKKYNIDFINNKGFKFQDLPISRQRKIKNQRVIVRLMN